MRPIWVLVALILFAHALPSQYVSDADLARALADPKARDGAIAILENSGINRLPILIKWTTAPPSGADPLQLDVGLADAFGQLRAREAIPFLVKHIGLDRTPLGNTWMKTPEAIESSLPAVAALIRIGPESAAAIAQAWPGMTDYRDRLAAMFVISRLNGVPWARGFLSSVLGESTLERTWAAEGLNHLDSPQ